MSYACTHWLPSVPEMEGIYMCGCVCVHVCVKGIPFEDICEPVWLSGKALGW